MRSAVIVLVLAALAATANPYNQSTSDGSSDVSESPEASTDHAEETDNLYMCLE